MDLNAARQTIADMNSGKTKWDDNVRAQANNTIDAADPVKQAQKIAQNAQSMQLQANQPAIQTLQNQYNPDTGGGALVDKYKTLLDSIKGSEDTAVDAQTLASNNELAKRGLTSDSGLYQSQAAKALAPVTTQFAQLKANTGVAEQQDLGNLAQQIASLRAGNVPNALQFGSGLAGVSEQAQNAQAQLAIQQALLPAQQSYYNRYSDPYYTNHADLYSAQTQAALQKLQNSANNNSSLPPISTIFG